MANKKTMRKRIRHDLLEKLKCNGTSGQHYIDLVEDYMELWDIKNMLTQDIQERGAVVVYVSNTGNENLKKNESVGELVKVNDRMVKLLDAIGISPAQVSDEDDEEM